MTRVYGGCVEPEGMDLRDEHAEVQCPDCSLTADRRYWQQVEAGSIASYSAVSCEHCGHYSGDVDTLP